MNLLEAIILGIVQGATEFLPVSSSGHLVLVSWWLGIDNPPLIYTVFVHLGTTAAIFAYFWKDWLTLFQAGLDALRSRSLNTDHDPHLELLVLLIIGTIPAAVLGLLLADIFDEVFAEPAIVSINLLVTAGLLIYGEWATRRVQRHTVVQSPAETENPTPSSRHLNRFDAIIIGLAQALAIMPGISRSGSTIAAGMIRGLDRPSATRYSFLLATPIILAAGFKQGLEIITDDASLSDDFLTALAVGFVVSAVVGYLCIALLLSIVRQFGFYGFAGYCVVVSLLSLGRVLLQG